MRFASLGAVLLAALSQPVNSVWVDDAWQIDYQYSLLGSPQEETSFFHRPDAGSRASLLYTLSGEGAVGAINPKDGAVIWRQYLARHAQSTRPGFLRAGDGQEVVVSGYGDEVAAWTAVSGRQAWKLRADGPLEDLEVLEMPGTRDVAGVRDIVILTSGTTPKVQRIDGGNGRVKWSHDIQSSGDTPFQLSASTTQIFAIMLHKTMLGNLKIKTITLDPLTGQKVDDHSLSSDSELANKENIIAVGANSASPVVVWTDAAHTVLKINVVGTKNVASFDIEKKAEGHEVQRVRLHAPFHVDALPHFLVEYETSASHWADVFHVDLKTATVDKAYSLPELAGKGSFSTSTSDANVIFTRITRDQVISFTSTSHGVIGKWPIESFGVVVGPNEISEPQHAVTEISIKGDTISALRAAVTLTTGEWVLLREGTAQWQRPEYLAGIRSAAFATPSRVDNYARELKAEARSNVVTAYVNRLARHLGELQRLPVYLAGLPQAFVRGFIGTTSTGDVEDDTFGFHKIIAAITANGRIVAFDSGNAARIIWTASLPSFPSLPTGSAPGSATQRIEALAGGVLRVTADDPSAAAYFNATTGQRIDSYIPPVDENDEASLQRDLTYKVVNGNLKAYKHSATPSLVWHFTPAAGDRILSLIPRPVNDPVASIGKVLGDRRVLYKYLDPNLSLLITGNDAKGLLTVYVLNTVTGAVLHSSNHPNVDLSSPVASVLSGNWFAYSYTALEAEDAVKGHHLVVGEMYESLIPNDRGPLDAAVNFSSFDTAVEPLTLTLGYQIPEPITKLAVTRTQQGITSRQLLGILPESNAIVGIPYGVVDPRRPVGRDPTKLELTEGLSRYSAVIEFDPKWYLNHAREVVGIKDIVTSPALLESTSILFAYGLDVFGTRLSPSFTFDILGKSFNKFQMLATVAGLAVATLAVAPLVARKQVNARWAMF